MQTIQQIFETKYAEENEISPEELAKSRWLSGDGFNLPRVNRAYRYFRDGYLAGQESRPSGFASLAAPYSVSAECFVHGMISQLPCPGCVAEGNPEMLFGGAK